MRAPSGTGPARRLIVLLGALLLAGCGAAVLPAIHSEQERLAVARRMLDRGDHVVAAELLRTFVANNAGSADVDEAIYLLGHALMLGKDWTGASGEFERLLRDYPESDSSAAARYGLAEAWFAQARPPDFDQEQTRRALEEWNRYLRDHPGHWRNEAARERVVACRTRLADKLTRTGTLYLKLDLPKPARVYFDMVIADYGDTVWAPEAEMGLARCDVLEGRRAEAIVRLQGIEARHSGGPIAARAARERKRLEER